MRPIIGLPTHSLEAIPGKPNCWAVVQRYVRVLAAAGAVPILIPLLPGDEEALRLTYQHLDGILLPGGVDVDPACYGEPRHLHCNPSDSARDWVEINLVRWALVDRKPIFGICRGVQVINVACGGSLYQHVPEQYPSAIVHDCFPAAPDYLRNHLAHSIRATPGSRLASLLGDHEHRVNSMHHQGIKRLASSLRATAHAPDGLIEGVEGDNGRYLVGVQWHPEELAEGHPVQMRLFTDFLEAAGAFRR